MSKSREVVTVEWVTPKRYAGFVERIARSRIRGKVALRQETRAMWRGKLYKVKIVDLEGNQWDEQDHVPLKEVMSRQSTVADSVATPATTTGIPPTSLVTQPKSTDLPPSDSGTGLSDDLWDEEDDAPLNTFTTMEPAPTAPTEVTISPASTPRAPESPSPNATTEAAVTIPAPPLRVSTPSTTQITSSSASFWTVSVPLSTFTVTTRTTASPEPTTCTTPAPLSTSSTGFATTLTPPSWMSTPSTTEVTTAAPPPWVTPTQPSTPTVVTGTTTTPEPRPLMQTSNPTSATVATTPEMTERTASAPLTTASVSSLHDLPASAVLYIQRLEERIADLERALRMNCSRKKTAPAYVMRGGEAVVGDPSTSASLTLNASLYQTAWSKSSNGREFVLKLMPLILPQDVMAQSNFFGGTVFNGKGWIQKFSLKDYPPFKAIIYQASLEFPQCFATEEDQRKLREAVNGKCRKASRHL